MSLMSLCIFIYFYIFIAKDILDLVLPIPVRTSINGLLDVWKDHQFGATSCVNISWIRLNQPEDRQSLVWRSGSFSSFATRPANRSLASAKVVRASTAAQRTAPEGWSKHWTMELANVWPFSPNFCTVCKADFTTLTSLSEKQGRSSSDKVQASISPRHSAAALLNTASGCCRKSRILSTCCDAWSFLKTWMAATLTEDTSSSNADSTCGISCKPISGCDSTMAASNWRAQVRSLGPSSNAYTKSKVSGVSCFILIDRSKLSLLSLKAFTGNIIWPGA